MSNLIFFKNLTVSLFCTFYFFLVSSTFNEKHKRLESDWREPRLTEGFMNIRLSVDTEKNDARRSLATLLSGCGMWIYRGL